MSTARLLIRDFLTFARERAALAMVLILAGALLEGLSVLVLIPVISLVLENQLDTPWLYVAGWGDEQHTLLWVVLCGFAGLLILRFGALFWRDVTLARLEQGFVADVRIRLFSALAAAPWTVAARFERGQIGHALTRDLDRAGLSIGAVLRGTSAAAVLFVQLLVAISLAPLTTLLASAASIACFLVLGRLRRHAQQTGRSLTEGDLRLFTTTGSFLRGLKMAKAHGIEPVYLDRFLQAANGFAAHHMRIRRDVALGVLTLQTMAGVLAIGMILAGHLWLELSAPVLIVLLLITMRLAGPLQAIQQSVQALGHGADGYRTASDLIAQHAPAAAPTISSKITCPPAFTFEDVRWGPEDVPNLLHVPNLEITAGTVLLLRGPSGIGKTTICDLVAGLHRPTGGRILMDGAVFDDFAITRLRGSLAYLGQEAFLPDTSVRNALAWSRTKPTDAELWEALEITGAAQLIRRLQGGLDGRLREDGTHLSGGERQRVRLASALLREPKLMILDEATNALDQIAEADVLQSVMAARKGATVVMVSHRVEALRFADKVYDVG